MDKKERKMLKLEENFESMIRKKLLEEHTLNKKILIKDIKLVGNIVNDEVTKKSVLKYLFIV